MDAVTAPTQTELRKQHLIDPEICIRCNTCEATCPVGAVTHDDTNYVVDAAKCNFCLDCIAPCPTGSIDNWRIVLTGLLARRAARLDRAAAAGEISACRPTAVDRGARRTRSDALLAEAHAGAGGKSRRARLRGEAERQSLLPGEAGDRDRARAISASPQAAAESDIRHIVLSISATRRFPCSKARSIGIVPPGTRRRRQSASHAALFDRLGARRREAQRQQSSRSPSSACRAASLELHVRSQGRRQGRGHRPVRRDLPDAERSGRPTSS